MEPARAAGVPHRKICLDRPGIQGGRQRQRISKPAYPRSIHRVNPPRGAEGDTAFGSGRVDCQRSPMGIVGGPVAEIASRNPLPGLLSAATAKREPLPGMRVRKVYITTCRGRTWFTGERGSRGVKMSRGERGSRVHVVRGGVNVVRGGVNVVRPYLPLSTSDRILPREKGESVSRSRTPARSGARPTLETRRINYDR